MIVLFSCFIIGVWFSLPKGMSLSLKGKHVFITGGSKGIGKETALEVIRRGAATVTIAARNLEALESAAGDIQTICKTGQNVKYYSMDAAGGYEKVC
uniref:Uncharacterized protein n=1 Tax=Panagrolaimus davidi TaxID=227884 RepID=A0A914RBN7_9BILA